MTKKLNIENSEVEVTFEEGRIDKQKNVEIAYKVYYLIKDMKYQDVCKLIEFIEQNFINQKNELKLKIDDCLKRRTDTWF